MTKSRKSPADRGLYPRRNAAKQQVWYVRLSHLGQLRTFGHFRTKTEARHFYQERKREQRLGQFFPEQWQRRHLVATTISDLVALVVAEYRRQQRKSLKSADQLAAGWTIQAGTIKAAHVTTQQLLAWADTWLAEGISPATINRRMAFLLHAFRLGWQQVPPLVQAVPRWTRLQEAPARAGYLEWTDFLTIRNALPAHVRLPATIGFWTGMRWGEIRSLRLDQVACDDRTQTVRLTLEAAQTKTRQSRIVVMGGDLYQAVRDALVTRADSPWLCHRNSHRLGTVDTAWKTACLTAKLATGRWDRTQSIWREYTGPLFHDLRRTGVRNLIRAGVDRDTAKRISGHKTDAVFSRYNIVTEEDLEEAGRKVWEYIRQQSTQLRQPAEPTERSHITH